MCIVYLFWGVLLLLVLLHTPTSALVSDCCQLEFVNMSKIHLRLAVFKTHAHQQSVLVVFYFSNPYPPLSVCIFPMHMLKTIYIYIMLSACSLKVHQLPSRYSYSRQNKLRSQQGEDNAMCVCVWVYMYIFYIYIFFLFWPPNSGMTPESGVVKWLLFHSEDTDPHCTILQDKRCHPPHLTSN